MSSVLLVEKYRPKTLAEIVLPEKTKQEIEKFKAAGTIPHILLVSNPGQGKTSLAKIIVNEVLDLTKDRYLIMDIVLGPLS